ncbi:hypothetical protein COLO4_20302 [Corchorus olitorius]|uniref:Uncharacterized protein n=1 Tax=Corchorus olitorius TaxID=93759 RepID=A0A1R3J0I6_9ROSI|nr:hypothetical protein COLO4_20302 [Corchorus olitorius]
MFSVYPWASPPYCHDWNTEWSSMGIHDAFRVFVGLPKSYVDYVSLVKICLNAAHKKRLQSNGSNSKRVLPKETQLHMAQKEFNKLKEQLADAKQQEFYNRGYKNCQARQIEEGNSSTLPGPGGVRNQDLETAMEQYMTVRDL